LLTPIFYFGVLGLAAFELAKVYLIMPLPGSQRMDSLDVAYVLHTWRWAFRLVLGLAALAGIRSAFAVRPRWRWMPALAILLAGGVAWMFNFSMTADQMFKQPLHLVLKTQSENLVDESSLVVGVERAGEAKAWPIRFLAYHHQVQDTVAGVPVLVTYCNVCRSGRVFEPLVEGRPEVFRLVGMDHFNAMFEDSRTGSWWRQATGRAVTGSLTGSRLPEVPSTQMTLRQFFALHPNALVMQPDEAFLSRYDASGRFERGESTGSLTRTDRGSWNEKSWVVGVEIDGLSKAYDWNRLRSDRVINDSVGDTPNVIALASDEQGFVVFERPNGTVQFVVEGDVVRGNGSAYDFSGRDTAGAGAPLRRISASQEFWHSWLSFHPDTLRDDSGGSKD
jgi:hypothetical protein